MEPKRAPKVVFGLLSKSYKNLVKHRVSARSPQQTNESNKAFCFFVDKRFFYNSWFCLSETEVSEC